MLCSQRYLRMSYEAYRFYRQFILSVFCLLSLNAIILGTMSFVMPSPSAKSQDYLVLADAYLCLAKEAGNDAQSQALLKNAQDMVFAAVAYEPYNKNIWNKLDTIRLSNDDLAANDLAFSLLE